VDIVFQCLYAVEPDDPSLDEVRRTSADVHDGDCLWRISVGTLSHKDETREENMKRHIERVIEEAFEVGKKSGAA